MLKISASITLFVLIGIVTDAQVIRKVQLTKEDNSKGVFSKYTYSPPKHVYHVGRTLTLYKNGRYEYYEADMPHSFYSMGKWGRRKKDLILNSDLQQNEVPLRIKHIIDSGVSNTTKISDVYDNKGSITMYVNILVNNDSTICSPGRLACHGSYKKIDSVRVLFGNRMSSQWTKIEDKPYERLEFTVDTHEDVMAYIPMHNKHFTLNRDTLLFEWRPLPQILPGW